jgi:hypothetical protein
MTGEEKRRFEAFTVEAMRYCEGISDVNARRYAVNYLCYLQAQAEGVSMDQPRAILVRLQETRLIRNELLRIYEKHLRPGSQLAC